MTQAYVEDVMTADVVAVRANVSYRDLAAKLRTHRVSGFPVVDDEGKVVGVVSESDLLAAGTSGSAGTFHHHPHQPSAAAPTAADLMTHPAVTVRPDEPVRRAAELMSARKLRRLPVVDHGGRLVGILSRADVLSVYARPDEDIRREVTQDVIMDGYFLDPATRTAPWSRFPPPEHPADAGRRYARRQRAITVPAAPAGKLRARSPAGERHGAAGGGGERGAHLRVLDHHRGRAQLTVPAGLGGRAVHPHQPAPVRRGPAENERRRRVGHGGRGRRPPAGRRRAEPESDIARFARAGRLGE